MRARPGLAALTLVLAVASSCKKDDEAPAAAASDRAAPEKPAPPPFTGALTAERIDQAKTQVLPHQPWKEAWPALRATVGEPTRIDGDLYGWYVRQGEACHFLEVTRDAQTDEVASSQHGAADALAASYFAKCAPGGSGAPAGEGEKAAPAPAAGDAPQGGR